MNWRSATWDWRDAFVIYRDDPRLNKNVLEAFFQGWNSRAEAIAAFVLALRSDTFMQGQDGGGVTTEDEALVDWLQCASMAAADVSDDGSEADNARAAMLARLSRHPAPAQGVPANIATAEVGGNGYAEQHEGEVPKTEFLHECWQAAEGYIEAGGSIECDIGKGLLASVYRREDQETAAPVASPSRSVVAEELRKAVAEQDVWTAEDLAQAKAQDKRWLPRWERPMTPTPSQQRADARSVLRELEWSGRSAWPPSEPSCPICLGFQSSFDGIDPDDPVGHTPDCRLAAAIRQRAQAVAASAVQDDK